MSILPRIDMLSPVPSPRLTSPFKSVCAVTVNAPVVNMLPVVLATVFGNSNQNAYGARTVSTGDPTGGSNGDIHYKI